MHARLCDTDAMNLDDKKLYRHMGAAIRKRREVVGMTQAQLADRVDLLRTSIVNVEAGRQRVPLHTLYSICAVLEVEAEDILPRMRHVLAEEQPAPQVDGFNKPIPKSAAAFVKAQLKDAQAQEDV